MSKSQLNLTLKALLLRQNLFNAAEIQFFEREADIQGIDFSDYLLNQVGKHQYIIRTILSKLSFLDTDFPTETKLAIPKIKNLDQINDYRDFYANFDELPISHASIEPGYGQGFSEDISEFAYDFEKEQKIITKRDFKNKVIKENQIALTEMARDHLFRKNPNLSAKSSLSLVQSCVMFALLFISAGLAIYDRTLFLNFLGIAISTFFLIANLIKLKGLRNSTLQIEQTPTEFPVYSILVPLFDEAAMVRNLCQHLQKMNYPKDKLDIKLIFEESDIETITAAKRLNLPEYFDFITVETSKPQTKPKALNYALPFCMGEYICVYDAEDRPDINQISNALSIFNQYDSQLACLQAKLQVDNKNYNWLSSHFHLEYRVQFNHLLHSYEAFNLPLPLGGTSNHFRADILRKVGGWDAYNVTEDADLGIRLFKQGYKVASFNSVTREHVSNSLSTWFKQRVRWQKGWLQTFITHTKSEHDPRPKQIAKTILLSASLLTNLLHPLSIILGAYLLGHLYMSFDDNSFIQNITMIFILTCWILGYAVSFLIYFVAMKKNQRPFRWRIWLSLPIYWLLISAAAWWALVDYINAPYSWSKTKHEPY